MQRKSVLSFLCLHCLLVESQLLTHFHQKIDLTCYYSSTASSNIIELPIATHLVQNSNKNNNAYVLEPASIIDRTIVVAAVKCIYIHCYCGYCERNFESIF